MRRQHDELHGLKPYMEISPPNIERVFGYDKYRRWVAFFWSKQEDACLSFDGYTYTHVSALAWDSFFSHQLIVALNHAMDERGLKKLYEFGDMHSSARHWLVLDRQAECLYVGQRSKVLDFFHKLILQPSNQDTGAAGQLIWMAENETANSLSSGRLEMINEMVQWMDHRLNTLKESGHWPRMIK